MTSLVALLARNMKERRRILGLSQAVLAEQLNTSTNYIAMIELARKTPSLPMIERIAAALGMEAPELFSMRTIPNESIKTLQRNVMEEIQQAVNVSVANYMRKLDSPDYTEEDNEGQG